MSVYAVVRCDEPGDQPCPNRVDVSKTPDQLALFLRELRRAGWSRTRRGDFCPAHSGGGAPASGR